jgi:hypothetical protein
MKKITSFLMMAVLGCASAFAYEAGETVGTELPKDVLVKIGTAQAEMVPGQWYFLHSPRNPNTPADAFAEAGGTITAAGGLVTDKGLGSAVLLTATTAIEELTAEEGVSAKNYTANMVRFVAVDGEEGAFNIQFGTGNWLADAPGSGTVNNNNYIAGNAGKYNFYLVTIGGEPNTAGRFGWNKYNMAQRVDNNGAGNGVVFWAEGEVTGEGEGWTVSEEIKGNKIWQIYDIQVVGTLDKFDEAWGALLDDYNTISNMSEGAFIDNMRNGVNVGTQPGNYLAEYVNAFLTIWDEVDELMYEIEMNGMEVLYEKFETVEDLEAYNKALVDAYNAIIQNKVPLATSNIVPGYYTINSCLYWYTTKNDTIRLTQEEADSINAENGYVEGDEGYVVEGGVKEVASKQVAAPKKALYSKHDDGTNADWAAWGTQVAKADFLWKIETVEGKPTEYRLINMANGKTHISIGQSSNSRLELNDTATVCFDWRNNAEAVTYADAEGNEVTDTVVSYNIRSSKQAESSYNYLHCGGHSGGAGTGSWIVGWSDGGATRWYLTPIDEATADQWINGPEAQLRAKIELADSIVAAFPAQLDIAKDMVTTVYEEDSVVVTADQFYSQYTTEDAQSIPEGQTVYDFMLDGKQSTYWHSKWENGAVGQKVHYLQVNAAEELNGLYCVKLQRRPVSGDHITELVVVGFVEEPTDETQFADGVELGTLKLPLTANNETVVTNTFDATGMNYLRFYSTTTAAAASGGGSGRGYWHASAFNVFKASEAKRYETTQYDARQAQADALKAAIEAWVAGAYTADDVAVLEDEAFVTAYNNLIAAAEAWGNVYVDPAALRAAIAAAPAANLFVIGNNPGQWKEGVATPTTVVEAAEAYNAAGAYNAEDSQAHIDAIAEATTNVYAQANPVQTGKWYRIKFPTEEMYETYGWDKTGAQATVSHDIEVSPALFGKTVAAANNKTLYQTYTNDEGDEAETATYYVEAVEEAVDGQRLGFFEEESEDGMDLFRFVQATDSTYMLQNKATGLFLRAGYPASLSAIPSYYYTKAIGAGASLIGSKSIFGGAEQGYAYLHGERSTNTLTTWSSSNLASNSMLMIEEVEDVTEEPTTEYMKKFWPGMTYAFTMPVETKIVDGATAYAAALQVNEEDTVIVLSTFESETIKAGTPYIVIADCEGEYVTTTQASNAIKEAMKEELGVETLTNNQQIEANQKVNDMFAFVTMEHGMVVDTVATNVLGLQGTMKQVTVEAGKGIVTKENGFAHTLVNTNVAAFGAYIVSDFDPESADVIGKLVVNIEGSVDTGINEVLNKVSQNGNIYNAAGLLVGKGNINTVNNLPAGIYVVNGVKVTKK